MLTTSRLASNVRPSQQQQPSYHSSSTSTAASAQPSHPNPPPNIHHPQQTTTIRIPMLSALQPPPNPQANAGPPQQQQQQGPLAQQGQSIPPPPPQNGQDYTLSSVLHFLQTEWRRYERDRNEWEIERAEMRARIALLEGERRSFENVKLDLMRRIKMLEYALRMERYALFISSLPTSILKQLGQPSTTMPSKPSAFQQSLKEDVKDGSSGSSPRSEDSSLPPERGANSVGPGPARQPSWSGNPPLPSTTGVQTSSVAAATIGTKPPPGRDPKSRARSREYLKQCLQEISYLTSPQAMNPLPNRPLITNPNPAIGPTPSILNPGSAGGVNVNTSAGAPSVSVSAGPGINGPQASALPQPGQTQGFFESIYNGRPKKQLPETNAVGQGICSTTGGLPGKEFPVMGGAPGVSNGITLPSNQASTPASTGSLERGSPLSPAGVGLYQNQQQPPPSQPQRSQMQPSPSPPSVEDGQQPKQLTAIFRPDSNWREKLRSSYQEQARRWHDSEEDEPEEGEEEDESESVSVGVEEGEGEGTKLWKPKRTLRSHLDAVRALAFHPTELCLATGGDDWHCENLADGRCRLDFICPQLTLRGHSAGITCLVHSPTCHLIYSASLDSSIRVWSLPSPSHTTYAPYDSTTARGELIGHTDAVWDLALVRDESTLISCGAEGTVKVWDVGVPGGGALRLTQAPTSVEAIKTELKNVAVAYQNAVVKIFEIETGKEVSRLPTEHDIWLVIFNGTVATQVNKIVSHPTMPLLITAHEDKFIRIFDIITGQCTYNMPAHLDGVTSLSIDVAGFALVSGSHDCSIRFWDLLGSRTCAQEITSHREKAKEGALDVEFHPSLPVMASAGADGVVKLYASS
ncbi:WD40-repeat-containing domain protein [Pisolithus orientalis]|uniref:WD40-repeat-containing domain protein n=1 Tax=Pisolithus orientalis TaxID=936130 RepID=UPI0022242432|nr:WD40-repeat-containing domain protein [Pisolithus orientalis]KAI6019608.1 WD40-repeat-containing domain protein [Pisolithus orientalis]